jgi:hypothetical protein
VSVEEAPRVLTAREARALALKAWEGDGKSRSDLQEGDEPVPWVLFVQESPAGFQRQHGYAWHARGNQVLTVHAHVRERSDASADSIKAALGGLTVDPAKTDAFLLAHIVAKNAKLEPTDPKVLLGVGQAYVGNDKFKDPAVRPRAREPRGWHPRLRRGRRAWAARDPAPEAPSGVHIPAHPSFRV